MYYQEPLLPILAFLFFSVLHYHSYDDTMTHGYSFPADQLDIWAEKAECSCSHSLPPVCCCNNRFSGELSMQSQDMAIWLLTPSGDTVARGGTVRLWAGGVSRPLWNSFGQVIWGSCGSDSNNRQSNLPWFEFVVVSFDCVRKICHRMQFN